jgi:Fe-S cluster assembly protein SufB
LEAYRYWLTLPIPTWGHVEVAPIDYQKISFYAAPKKKEGPKNLDEVDPEILKTFDKLGIPLHEREMLSGVQNSTNMAVDAIVDSESQKTTYKEKLAELGIIFCSFNEAVKSYPQLVQKYMGKVVPYRDNYYAALNSAVFSDGSFVYIPKGVRCPMELASYFRINASGTGQFERTLIIADDDAYVSYLEGCTAPMRDENQLHAAVVEIYIHDRAEVKYSTVQNWFPGDKNGRGGVYNLVTKRALCHGDFSKISWTQVETGSAITWKYPSCVLRGDNSQGEFYSVAVTNNYQQADTGTKMIHIGKNTRSRIVSKGISAGHSQNSYRGLVKVVPGADNVRNYTQCDSLLLSDTCGAHTFPVMEVQNPTAVVEHEATTSKINEQQLFYCNQRGIGMEEAVSLIVGGYAKEVVSKLPMEFAVEAQKLLSLSIENSVG